MFNRIIVGVDFSEASRSALERGADWAAQLRMPLTAIHVVEMPRYPAVPPYTTMGDPSWFQDLAPKIEERLREWIAPYPGTGSLVRAGIPAEVLMEEATPEALLVVGQVGHSKLEHLLFGSTAAKVARHAACDVLVVHAGKRA